MIYLLSVVWVGGWSCSNFLAPTVGPVHNNHYSYSGPIFPMFPRYRRIHKHTFLASRPFPLMINTLSRQPQLNAFYEIEPVYGWGLGVFVKRGTGLLLATSEVSGTCKAPAEAAPGVPRRKQAAGCVYVCVYLFV